jgi:formate-dependent nitrite reductase cytochrome c552 subunit
MVRTPMRRTARTEDPVSAMREKAFVFCMACPSGWIT